MDLIFVQSEGTLQFLRSDECEVCDFARNYNSKRAENLDACIKKAYRVFGVRKLFPEEEKALKAFIDKKDVWEVIGVPDGSTRSRGALNL